MVKSLEIIALGVFAGFAQFVSAGIALPAPGPAITPPPLSPFDPRSPHYGMMRRDDKKDKMTTADGTSTCGFASGDIGSALTCGDQGSCTTSSGDGNNAYLGCCKDDCTVTTACYERKSAGDNGDDDGADDAGVSCYGKNGKCVTYNVAGAMSFTCSDKGASIKADTVARPSTTSSSSTSTTSSSSTTSTASTTSGTPTPTPSSAPSSSGLAGYAVAGIVIGSVLGAAAIGMILYHFIRSKISPDTHGDAVPLIENQQAAWRGPWQGREG